MTRIHEQMLSVLTPEQRAKVIEMHGQDHESSGLHDMMKKLHGGQ